MNRPGGRDNIRSNMFIFSLTGAAALFAAAVIAPPARAREARSCERESGLGDFFFASVSRRAAVVRPEYAAASVCPERCTAPRRRPSALAPRIALGARDQGEIRPESHRCNLLRALASTLTAL